MKLWGTSIFTVQVITFSSLQLLSHVWLFVTPWTVAPQDSLSITSSQNLLKLMSIESVMSSNHHILCILPLLLLSIFPSIKVFPKQSSGGQSIRVSDSMERYGKTILLTRWTFDKVMSLLFNILSRLVMAFLPKIKCLLISWLHSPSAVILQLKKMKSVTVSLVSPYFCHEVMGLDAMCLHFWNVECKASFFTLLFHFHQEVLQFLFAF